MARVASSQAHTCLFADVSADCAGETSEHLVPECVGGAEERPDVICHNCNQYFSEAIDPQLCQLYEHAITLLAPFMPAKFHNRRLRVTSVDGDIQYKIRPGGVLELAKIQRLYDSDGAVRAVIGPGGTNTKVQDIASRELDPNKAQQIVEEPESRLWGPHGPVLVETTIRLGDLRRSVVKVALENLHSRSNEKTGHPVTVEADFRDARNYARNGRGSVLYPGFELVMCNVADELDHAFHTRAHNSFSNRLMISYCSRSRTVFAVLQILGTLPLGVRLATGHTNHGGDWTFLFERGVFRGEHPRVEWLKFLPLSYADFDRSLFSGRTLDAISFASIKLLQSIFSLHSRAIIHGELNANNVGHTLYTQARDLVFNAKVTEGVLSRAVLQTLRLRYRNNEQSVIESVLARIATELTLPDEDMRRVLDGPDLGPYNDVVLSAYRLGLCALLQEVGLPDSYGLVDHTISRIPTK